MGKFGQKSGNVVNLKPFFFFLFFFLLFFFTLLSTMGTRNYITGYHKIRLGVLRKIKNYTSDYGCS